MLVLTGLANGSRLDYYEPADIDVHADFSQRSGTRPNGVPYIEKFDACELYLYKSCPGRVAFYILKTPVFAGRPRTYYRTSTTQEYVEAHPNLTKSAYHAAAPSFCPVTAVRSVKLAPGAALTERCPTELRSTLFDLSLHDIRIESTAARFPDDEQTVNTVIELAKLAGLQVSPLPRGVHKKEMDKVTRTRRSSIGWYSAEPHLSFIISESAFGGFIEKVGISHTSTTVIRLTPLPVDLTARTRGKIDT
jgi:hypothetical protein